MHPKLIDIQTILQKIKEVTNDKNVCRDIDKILASLNKKSISSRLLAIFHQESKSVLSTLYKNAVPNEEMSETFNFLNKNKTNKSIFYQEEFDFKSSYHQDDERWKKNQEELKGKEQLLKKSPQIIMYLDSLTKDENDENYNAPFFIKSIEKMKDILDGDYDPYKFNEGSSTTLYDNWYAKIKTTEFKDGLAGIHQLQKLTLEALWNYSNEKICLMGNKYFTNKNPLAMEHMFRKKLFQNFSNKLKQLIKNINIDIQKDKHSYDHANFQNNNDCFIDINEFKMFKLWMLCEQKRGNLDKDDNERVLDPTTNEFLVKLHREDQLQYIGSTFLNEINNAPIKSQIYLYSKANNNRRTSLDIHDILQENYCDLHIFLEEHLTVAMKLCNMLRIDHPKYNKELQEIIALFDEQIISLITNHIYFDKSSDIKDTCDKIIKMVEKIKSLSESLEKKCLEIDPKSAISPQVQDETQSIFAKILDVLYKILDKIKYILGIDNLKAPIYHESLNSLRENEARINSYVNNFNVT